MKNRQTSTLQLIKSDLERIGRQSFLGFLKAYFHPCGSTFPYVVWLRIVHHLKKKSITKYTLGPLAYLILRHFEFKYGIQTNTDIEIGMGLKIVHGGAVFLNCKQIGNNATVYQSVTFGSNHGSENIPTLEDNVTVFPGAVVVGNITLGHGCTVGALSYVSENVPPESVVVGAPAHRIK